MAATPQHDDHQHGTTDPGDMIAFLDHETAALAACWDGALDWVAASVGDQPPTHIADYGAGNGVGALGLAHRFPDATVYAVDAVPELGDLIRTRAAAVSPPGRVEVLTADLNEAWPSELHDLDLQWASMSLHHTDDPAAVLRRMHAAAQPGGWLAVVESGRALSFSSPAFNTEHPGVMDRAMALTERHLRTQMPTLGTPWAPRVAAASWDVITEREFAIELDPPSSPDAVAVARRTLGWALATHDEPAVTDGGLSPTEWDALVRLRETTDDKIAATFRGRGSRVVTLAHRN